MLGLRVTWLRFTMLTLAGLLLASGMTWAHGGGGGGHGGGGGGHGGGGHGGYGGGMHAGGIGHGYGGVGYGLGGYHGLGYGGYGRGYGLGYGVYGRGYGLGYGVYGRGYGLGYGGFGLGYGIGYGLGYGLGYGGYGLGYGGYGYGGGYPYYGGYSSGYGGVNVYSNPVVNTYSNYYPQATEQEPQTPPNDNLAHLLVIVPENAELLFNGTKTKQTGPQREFISPELTAGKHYSYEIKASWMENGKRKEEVRTAEVQTNTWKVIDFTKPEPSAEPKK
jgi:uncharacterized protein (TIGR03000 family)